MVDVEALVVKIEGSKCTCKLYVDVTAYIYELTAELPARLEKL